MDDICSAIIYGKAIFAFYVTCCRDSADLFYDEQRWPESVELRDWVYK